MLVLPGVTFMHVFSVLFGVINAAIIFYLAMPPIKRAFHEASNRLRAAA